MGGERWVDPCFEVNLYAADPLLAKPIQMNFDAAGRLCAIAANADPFPMVVSAAVTTAYVSTAYAAPSIAYVLVAIRYAFTKPPLTQTSGRSRRHRKVST